MRCLRVYCADLSASDLNILLIQIIKKKQARLSYIH